MTSNKRKAAVLRRVFISTAAAGAALLIAACGGGGSGGTPNVGGGGGGGNTALQQAIAACEAGLPTTPMTAGNQMAVIVDAGPCTSSNGTVANVQQVVALNSPFTTVTICIPGKTGAGNCQQIDHVLVDTGSSGLRIAASALTLTLPGVTLNGSQLYECMQFGSGFSWGSVRAADVAMASETTANRVTGGISVQVIGDSENVAVPTACSDNYPGTAAQDSVYAMQANGILGVGLFIQDCGGGCYNAATTAAFSSLYYLCPGSDCSAQLSVGVNTQQLTNPVYAFTGDYQGVILSMQSMLSAQPLQNQQPCTIANSAGCGAATLGGYLTFGINSEAGDGGAPGSLGGNNDIASTQGFYQADPSTGNLNSYVTNVGGTLISSTDPINTCPDRLNPTLTPPCYQSSFLDSGSNAIYAPIPSTNAGSPVPTAWISADSYGFYNPTSAVTMTATIQGYNGGTIASPSYVFQDADTLFGLGGGSYSALMGIGAPNSSTIALNTSGLDWGLPFFFGVPVVVAIETVAVTVNSVAETGPFWVF